MRRALIFVLALIPPLLALGVAFLFEQGIFANVSWIGNFDIDAAGMISRGGLLGGGLIIFVLLTVWWAEGRAEATFQAEKRMQADTRRRFFGRLDHELKNPLTIIKLGVTNIEQSPNITAVQNSSLNRIGQQAERLQKLVEDLRWLSELEVERLESYTVDLAEVLAEAIELVRATFPGRMINFQVQSEAEAIAAVSGDRDMLVVVFRNLMDNALKYSSAKDVVEVQAADEGEWVKVEIADTGVGIPERDLPRVFEELYRSDNVQTIPGSGLGLALVWRIVKLHDGRINLESQVGQGTVIQVRLRALLPEN
ncbi:MAG: HAMP domain-containing sensor histidine kinase [Candidatus Promineifilaceae bacterium]